MMRFFCGTLVLMISLWPSDAKTSTNTNTDSLEQVTLQEAEEHTLNYNIRILGREGYLLLNVIGDMNDRNAIQQNIQPILNSVDFTGAATTMPITAPVSIV